MSLLPVIVPRLEKKKKTISQFFHYILEVKQRPSSRASSLIDSMYSESLSTHGGLVPGFVQIPKSVDAQVLYSMVCICKVPTPLDLKGLLYTKYFIEKHILWKHMYTFVVSISSNQVFIT